MSLFQSSPIIENVIGGFDGEYRFLSNFWMVPFTIDGWRWPSAEHAYQASKSVDVNEWIKIQNIKHPAAAKKAGLRLTLRNDWGQVRIGFMKYIIDHKFDVPELRDLLLSTSDARLVELNHWGDVFWGVDKRTKQGKNHLGIILMDKRERD